MGAHKKLSLEQIVEFRHEFKTNIALWLTMSYRTGVSRSVCQTILANTAHSDTSYSPQLLTKRQTTWLAKYIRENEVDRHSFHMTREQLSEYMNKIPERKKAKQIIYRQAAKLKRQAASLEKFKARLALADIERSKKLEEKQRKIAEKKAASATRIKISTESEEEKLRKLLQDKADAIQPRPNPLTWWIPPTPTNIAAENGDAQI